MFLAFYFIVDLTGVPYLLLKWNMICSNTRAFDSFVTKTNQYYILMFLLLPLYLHKAERKKYEKETEKYYSSLEKLLNMSAKKKDTQLQEVFICEELNVHNCCLLWQ